MVQYANPAHPECEAEPCEEKHIEGLWFALTTSGLSGKKLIFVCTGRIYYRKIKKSRLENSQAGSIIPKWAPQNQILGLCWLGTRRLCVSPPCMCVVNLLFSVIVHIIIVLVLSAFND